MQKLVVLLLMFLCDLSFSQEGKTFSTYETFEDVKTIQINNNLCVIFYPTNFYGVSIKGDKSVQQAIKTEFNNSVLKLYSTLENTLTNNAEITIYIKDLKELQLFGTSWVQVQTDKKIVSDTFKIFAQEQGSFNLPIDCKSFSLNMDVESKGSLVVASETIQLNTKGSSKVSMKLNATNVSVEQTDDSSVGLSGKTRLLTVNIDKKAQLSAWGLKAEDVYLNSNNANEIRIQVAKRLKINDKGTAKIFVRGNPKQVDTLKISAKTRISYDKTIYE